jgi:hypothetical protein
MNYTDDELKEIGLLMSNIPYNVKIMREMVIVGENDPEPYYRIEDDKKSMSIALQSKVLLLLLRRYLNRR